MLTAVLAATVIAATAVVEKPSYAPTPQRAVVQTFGPAVRVIRTNVVGRYATVASRGAVIEGEPLTDAILLEHFEFGWQPLEILNVRCRLDTHALSADVNRRLMTGMPPPQAEPLCSGATRDVGPADAVAAIRMQMRGPFVPAVAVAGRFAIGSWYGAGGGESLFGRDAGGWVRLTDGGGAMDADIMRQNGVPRNAWCTLGISDAGCPR